MKYKSFLKENFFLFSSVNEQKIDQMLLFDGISIEEYAPQDILQSSKTQGKIGIIIKGNAIIRSGDDGVIIRKLTSKDTYGAACLFDKPTYLTYVSAVSNCSVITFNKDFIEKCIAYDENVAKNYISFLAKRISFLNSKINSYTAKNAENKLYAYLLQLPRNDNVIELKVSLSTLAKMIGIGRASLYRALEKLENNGTITKQDKKIILNEV
ncbi:MAG: Crp/Fnr family transcriptional regulator [Clostridia bacterium]|nr:Crp/Fnr family transcriptional regulator [Clostridia bacterium]